MDIILVLTNLGFVAGFFFCLLYKVDAIRNDLDSFRNDVHKENKDFHGRLCAIEERRKGKK